MRHTLCASRAAEDVSKKFRVESDRLLRHIVATRNHAIRDVLQSAFLNRIHAAGMT